MLGEWKLYIEDKKKEYQKMVSITCAIFQNEKIYFMSSGFNHLIRKERKYREKHEQIRRLELLKYAPGILKRCKEISTHRVSGKIQFWSLHEKING